MDFVSCTPANEKTESSGILSKHHTCLSAPSNIIFKQLQSKIFFFWWTLIHFQSVSSSAFNDLNIFLNIYFPCNIHTTHFLLIFVCIEWKYWLLYGITKHLENTDKTSILKASTVDGWAMEFLGVRVTLQCVTASLFGQNWKKKRRAQKKL